LEEQRKKYEQIYMISPNMGAAILEITNDVCGWKMEVRG
jgi:hypothetical protein